MRTAKSSSPSVSISVLTSLIVQIICFIRVRSSFVGSEFMFLFSMLSSNTLSKSLSNVGLAFMHYLFILAMAKCLEAFVDEGALVGEIR